MAQEFELAVSELPSISEISLANADQIMAIAKGYNSLSEYQKSFISDDALKAFTEKYERYNQLVKAQESIGGNTSGTESTEGSEGAENTESTEGVESTTGSGDAADSGDAEA